MVSQLKDINRNLFVLLFLAVVLISTLTTLTHGQVLAEGNPPTETPTITLTTAPPPTSEPTTEPVDEDSGTGSKEIEGDTPQDDAQDETQIGTSPDDNAAPISNSPTGGLVGVIVVAATIVMFMVVYGVIQRVRS